MKKLLKKEEGFTLIELMIVVVIIGILAAIAIPNFQKFQLKSKSAEGPGNIGGIANANAAFEAKWGRYLDGSPVPRVDADLDGVKTSFYSASGPQRAQFKLMGWEPSGDLYFNYGVIDGSGGAPTAGAVDSGTPGGTHAAAAATIAENNGRAEIQNGLVSAVVIAHANIDEDAGLQGYFKVIGGGDIVPDPLDSGENEF